MRIPTSTYTYKWFGFAHLKNYYLIPNLRTFTTNVLLESGEISKRYRALCSPGLETYLSKEVKNISKENPLKIDKGLVEFIAGTDVVWNFLLQTKICQSLWVYLMEPFHVTHEKEFIRKVSAGNWNHLIKFDIDSKMPNVKVTCSNSRLSHTNMIKKCIIEIVHLHKMNTLNLHGDVTGSSDPSEPAPPLDINVTIVNNTCRIIINVSGNLDNRFYLINNQKLPILPSTASAISTYILNTIESDLSSVTIWDPFCNNGVMLLELYNSLCGSPIGSPNMDYPLKKLPYNEDSAMNKALNSLIIEPIDLEVALLGSDHDDKIISVSNDNLAHFERLRPKSNISDTYSRSKISFTTDKLKDIIDRLGKTMIVTNMMYGDKKSEEMIQKSYKLLSNIIKARPDWIDVYVVSGRSSFRRHVKFEWNKELSFNNQGIKCELLRLAKP